MKLVTNNELPSWFVSSRAKKKKKTKQMRRKQQLHTKETNTFILITFHFSISTFLWKREKREADIVKNPLAQCLYSDSIITKSHQVTITWWLWQTNMSLLLLREKIWHVYLKKILLPGSSYIFSRKLNLLLHRINTNIWICSSAFNKNVNI